MIPLLLLLAATAAPDDYHVSPAGRDEQDGRSPERAWRSVAKVNASTFAPGDRILFARGGEWRESLKANSSGAPGKPVTYAAYGKGARPKFWGSDVIDPRKFRPLADTDFEIDAPARVASVLVDHVFLPPKSWTWAEGRLRVSTPDPRKDTRLWTVCTRVDPVHSNGRNHLVFRDLVADESADERDGYGFRIMGSEDVRVEDCEAYRAGRHHFGVINSTRFTGLRLQAAHAMPACPGGATFYVSFSDATRKGDTHEWIDCSGSGFENPGQGNYQIFYDHGEGLGPILLRNMTSKGGMFTVAGSNAAPFRIQGGLLEDNSLVVYGSAVHVDGLTIKGNGAVDVWSSESLFENLHLPLKPLRGGPTGYGAAFVLRDGARRNTIRFNTVQVEDGDGVTLLTRGSGTQLYGNVLLASRGAVLGAADASDLVFADFNHYREGGRDWAPWRALGFDAHSTGGDPKLDASDRPLPGSPLLQAARLKPEQRPAADLGGRKRPSGPACSIGAFEP